ncbi:SGNH/GDSL hydrolase family protein [Acinetobacter sp. WCHAc010034]|uniref:SGNH/GDSL hydrolase family protein n=1 Tax=Acinetobacter sp. WCHAc010034 TaxID=1879049 RepID=UPI00083AC915|nr:SGNH/GDSL hydrolase family protein [Acinetobacter sp. WCHAc010034]AYA02334.1 SGNH/GDSL hydrolase family protein [Acinetobacter sp. WCHAc010034]
MPNLEVQPGWPAARQLDRNEFASGGPDGNLNEHAKVFLARTEYLQQQKANKSEIVQGHYEFGTYAEFNLAKSGLPLNCTVIINEINSTGTGSWNQGSNRWNGSTLSKSENDPLEQSKEYTNKFFTNYAAAALLTVKNKFIQKTTGQEASGASFDSSDFIPVIGGESYDVYSYVTVNASHAWYDVNKNFISAFGEDQTSLSLRTFIAPESARYLRISAYNTQARQAAYLKSSGYAIEKVKKIITQHTPNVDANKVIYDGNGLDQTIINVINKQDIIVANQNSIISQLDLITDQDSPFFVNTFQYTRSGTTPNNFNIVDVTARVSANVMTVSDPTAFVYGSACVVYDSVSDSYTSHAVLQINGMNITVSPSLPNNPSKVQTMHDSPNGQHLTLFGTKGLADYVLKSIQKYSYKKSENLIFKFNSALCCYLAWNNSDIYNSDASQLLIPVTKVGTAGNGGYTPGTTNLAKICAMSNPKDSYINIGDNPHTQYLSRAYNLIDGVAGNGFEISFNGQGSDGFIEIPLAVRDASYISSVDSQTYKTSGKARLQIFNDSALVHDVAYAAGQVHSVFVDFARGGIIKIRITCESSVPTYAALSGIFAYKKSAKTSKDTLFKDGDVIVFLMDSWGIYPVASTIGETPYVYPISNLATKYQAMYPTGYISNGTHWISRRIQEKLANQGINVETYSYAFGGQTTRWGKYWLDAVLTMSPKPTHCVINFGINDNNSIGNPSNTFYDFDPEKMFANKAESLGGINGRTASFNEWELNLKWIAERCLANGVKPVIMMPAHTASTAQAQSIRQNELVRLADGFGE